MNNRPLVPAFLNKLDNHLLLNTPSLWTTRAHLVFYYSLLFLLALAGAYYVVPDDPRSYSTVDVWVGMLLIVCIIAVVAWLIYLLRFNVFKRFGHITPATTLADFLLYYLILSVIASSCLLPPALETLKAHNQYTSSELADDMNNINIDICMLQYDSLPKRWQSDTLRIVDTIPGRTRYSPPPAEVTTETTDMVSIDTVTNENIHRPYRVVDTAGLRQLQENGDSLTVVNDSTRVLYVCPEYRFLNDFYLTQYTDQKVLTSQEIYVRVFRNYVPPDRASVTARLQKLIDKYWYQGNERPYMETSRTGNYTERIRRHYRLANVEDSFDHISERKFRWHMHGAMFLWMWFYSSFILALLVLAFRRSTVKVFFLSLLTAVIIFILTALFLALFRSGDQGIYLWMIFYFVLFTVVSATAFAVKTRKAVQGIAINLFMFMVPFVPLIAVSMYYYHKQRLYSYPQSAIIADYHEQELHYLLAQIGGPLLLLVLLVAYVHGLYRRWYGLPGE